MNQTATPQRVTFSVLGSGRSRTGVVRDGNAKLGPVAARIARTLGLVGGFECLNAQHEVLSPEMHLSDLPDEDVRLVPEHTPAGGA